MTTSQLDQGAAPADHDRALVDAAMRDASRIAAGSSALASLGVINHPPPDKFPGYDIIEEIHRGAQGVVYRAVQHRTNRQVAIKVLRGGPFASRHAHQRFDREIQILARLKHPNIVTIHDSGVTGDCLYFIMDYIPGQPPNEYATAGRLSVPETLALFAKISRAVNAAHLHGVIHRDLKPGNIRVDQHGQPHVLDFGLAKTMGSIGVPPVCSPSPGSIGVPPVCSPSPGSAGVPPASGSVGVPPANPTVMTETGQFIGSLPWASPEQAEGLDTVDLRTDVYSLGVILYQMLTDKFPYPTTRNTREMLATIANTDPLRPGINNEIDTITLKCLAKDPARRYQSAGELAKDVERYLTGEPIEAKRDSTAYVLRKQLRKHKLRVAVAAAFLIVVFAGLGTSLTFWRQAADERDRAEVNFQKARDAVDRMLTRVAQDELAGVPQMEPIRRELLEDALEFYQGFLQEQRENPAVQYDTALAFRRIGDIRAALSEHPQAEPAFRESIALLEPLLDRDPANRDYRSQLGISHANLGLTLEAIAQLEAAENAHRTSIELFREPTAEDPSEPIALRELGAAYVRLGKLLGRTGRVRDAETAFREALTRLEKVAADPQRTEIARARLGNAHHSLGGLLARDGRHADAEPYLLRAVEVLSELSADWPDSTHHRIRLSDTYNNLAILYTMTHRFAEAAEFFGKTIAHDEKLTRDFPTNSGYRARLAGGQVNLALVYVDSGRPAEAEPVFRDAALILQRLVADYPNDRDYRKELERVYYGLADLLKNTSRLQEAEQAYEKGIAILEQLVAEVPTVTEYRYWLAVGRHRRSEVLTTLGRDAEAQEGHRKAADVAERFLAEFSDNARFRKALVEWLADCSEPQLRDPDRALELAQVGVKLAPQRGDLWRSLGMVNYRAGNWQAAVNVYAKASELQPDYEADFFELAMAHWQLGSTDEARKWYDRSVAWTQKHLPDNRHVRRLRAEAAQLLGIDE